jgi:hypothetical protein
VEGFSIDTVGGLTTTRILVMSMQGLRDDGAVPFSGSAQLNIDRGHGRKFRIGSLICVTVRNIGALRGVRAEGVCGKGAAVEPPGTDPWRPSDRIRRGESLQPSAILH